MLIAIDCGHGLKPDTGASGNGFLEDNLTLEVGSIVADLLKKRGHSIVFVRPQAAISVNDSLNRRVQEANKWNAQLYISIHFNAFSNPAAEGAEVFVHNANSRCKPQATQVLDNLCDLGFRRRGVKYATFAVLRNTNMPAMLVECCFLTSRRDMQRFEAREVASAIACGILGSQKIKSEKVTLTIATATLLKPTTAQSSEIDINLLIPIGAGNYECELVGEDEGHYLIKYEGREYFIYSQHCAINA